jgi:hypothetical protein
MATQPIPRPVEGCQTCQKQYSNLQIVYRMWYACPGDPGAQGVFEASREDYEKHHASHTPALSESEESASC